MEEKKLDPNEFIATYFYEIKRCVEALNKEIIKNAIDILMEAYQQNRTIYIIGNGGSATTASHMACDLGKGTAQDPYDTKEKRLKVISLTDNVAVMTALANDLSFEDIFIQQLRNVLEKDDIVIAISASGNSQNVIKAVEYAKKNGAKTIGMLGFKNGGKLAKIVDCAVIVDSMQYGPIEDIHLILNHLIASWIGKIKITYGDKKNRRNENNAVPFKDLV